MVLARQYFVGGDNDLIDIIEFGSVPLEMGSINPCRISGSLELVDKGETDYKMMRIALTNLDASRINSLAVLDSIKPCTVDK